MEIVDRLREAIKILKERNIVSTQGQIAIDLGYRREQTISDIVKEKTPLTTKFGKAFCVKYGIREEWLFEGKEPMFLNALGGREEQKLKAIPVKNARPLGLPIDIHTPKSGTQFIELSEGYYMMYPHRVTVRARAGFQGGGYGDPEFIDSLPVYPMVVRTVHKGNYLVFDIDGDSMDDGSIRSIPDGSMALGREIKMDLWKSKFHYNEFPFFIIVHKTDGILCKEIIEHDTVKGCIKCHSLNPNKKMYPDFELKLDECLQIFNIVKKETDTRA